MAVELAEPLQSSQTLDRLDRFESLYQRYHAPLVSACTAMTGDRAAAEDVAQEAMLRAYQHLDWLDVSRAWPWLKTVASRLVIDEYRKWGRVGALADDHEVPADASQLEGAETRHVLAEAMSRLPARQRLAMTLRYVAGYDSAEAAAALDLDASAFKQLLYRARGRLQSEYRRLTAGVAGVALWPLMLLRRGRAAVDRLRHSLTFNRLRSLLHPAIELGAALLVFTTLALTVPLHRTGPSSVGSASGRAAAAAIHRHGHAGFGPRIGWWIGLGTWLPSWAPAAPGKDATKPTVLCAAPAGSNGQVSQTVNSAVATLEGVAPVAASVSDQAASAVCPGGNGPSILPGSGESGPGPIVTLSVGGVLVSVPMSSLPSGVAKLVAQAVRTGAPLPADVAEKLQSLPQVIVQPDSSKTDSSKQASKGDSSKDGDQKTSDTAAQGDSSSDSSSSSGTTSGSGGTTSGSGGTTSGSGDSTSSSGSDSSSGGDSSSPPPTIP
jgi:RNA polymerase sigma-70 factor, ECF subfamily